MALYKTGLVRRKLVFDGRLLVERLRELTRIVAEKDVLPEDIDQFKTSVDALANELADWRAEAVGSLESRLVG